MEEYYVGIYTLIYHHDEKIVFQIIECSEKCKKTAKTLCFEFYIFL